MIPARSNPGPRTAIAMIAAGMLLSGCYYPYGYPPYSAYPSYPVVGAAYTQQEFSLPAQAASGTMATTPGATLPPEYQYAVGSYGDYYPAYPYPYPPPYYPPYGAYPAYYGYGYPAVSIGFGYWGGGGCCWGHGWHGNGWHGGGGGWHGGGGGWHGGGGGGSSWGHGGGGHGH
ncbi:hypothetical protein AWB71_00901 [Caballeronia peredens]|nr:hypothetical protein AWB71_00901 [Caballeronia peredens]